MKYARWDMNLCGKTGTNHLTEHIMSTSFLGYLRYMGVLALSVLAVGCSDDNGGATVSSLSCRLHEVADAARGTVGIALVSEADTIVVNNGVAYAMMSVFKLHQSLAVCDALERRGVALDTVIGIRASELDPDTWSPMLKEYGMHDFDISAGELVRRSIVSSDNNASNILFGHIVSPEETDRYVRTIATDTTFRIGHSEAEMKADHALIYDNYSSPLAAAILIRRVFTQQFLSSVNQQFVRDALSEVTTGHDRIGAPLEGVEGILFGHKTGSGYRNSSGELTAFNDVAYVRLPDGRDYALAVMIRDFRGSEAEAAAIMSEISTLVYDYFTQVSLR